MEKSARAMRPTLAHSTELTFANVGAALFAGDGIGTHVRTATYFACFLGCLAYVLRRFPWGSATIVVPYSMAALAYTWRLILIFFVEHTQRFTGHPDPPNLFVEAYVLVCDSAAGWWWSSVLLLWVTIACPMAHAEAIRRGMPMQTFLAYVVVAFLGAVSLAFPLLLMHLLKLPPVTAAPAARTRTAEVWWAWPTCVAAALVSIALLPWSVHASRPVFIVALAVVHFVLVLPPAQAAMCARSPALLGASAYRLLAVLAAALQLSATVATTLELRKEIAHRWALARQQRLHVCTLLARLVSVLLQADAPARLALSQNGTFSGWRCESRSQDD